MVREEEIKLRIVQSADNNVFPRQNYEEDKNKGLSHSSKSEDEGGSVRNSDVDVSLEEAPNDDHGIPVYKQSEEKTAAK